MVLSRDALQRRCWDFAFATGSNVVEVQVRSLRDKVDRPFQVASVETVRGAGHPARYAE
jgi:two-component system, OmpR family, response regulator